MDNGQDVSPQQAQLLIGLLQTETELKWMVNIPPNIAVRHLLSCLEDCREAVMRKIKHEVQDGITVVPASSMPKLAKMGH